MMMHPAMQIPHNGIRIQVSGSSPSFSATKASTTHQCKQLEEALAGEEPVQVEFELRNRFRRGPIVLNNVVADLVGTEYPEHVLRSG